jgi:DNA-3-methyladenine glycosylase I
MTGVKRCEWANTDSLYKKYHDDEWGVPLHDDKELFEFLILEGAQAGLSWSTIAGYTDKKVTQLLNNPGIVRNRLKVHASIVNAKAFLKVQDEFGSFDTYIWGFVGGKPVINGWEKMNEIPSHTPESDAMSRDLKKRGFKFAGSTICYAFMQAVGMVNDHMTDCFRYKALNKLK